MCSLIGGTCFFSVWKNFVEGIYLNYVTRQKITAII